MISVEQIIALGKAMRAAQKQAMETPSDVMAQATALRAEIDFDQACRSPETITLPRETVEAYVALMRVIEEKCEPCELPDGLYMYSQMPDAVGTIVHAWRLARKAGG